MRWWVPAPLLYSSMGAVCEQLASGRAAAAAAAHVWVHASTSTTHQTHAHAHAHTHARTHARAGWCRPSWCTRAGRWLAWLASFSPRWVFGRMWHAIRQAAGVGAKASEQTCCLPRSPPPPAITVPPTDPHPTTHVQILAKTGADFPDWYDAGKIMQEKSSIPFGELWAESMTSREPAQAGAGPPVCSERVPVPGHAPVASLPPLLPGCTPAPPFKPHPSPRPQGRSSSRSCCSWGGWRPSGCMTCATPGPRATGHSWASRTA